MRSLCCNLGQAVALVHRRRAASATTTMTIGRRGAARTVMMMTATTLAAVKWVRPLAVPAVDLDQRLAAVDPDRVATQAPVCGADLAVLGVAVSRGDLVDQALGPACAAGHVAPAEAAFLVGEVRVRALGEAWVLPVAVRGPQRSPSSFSVWNASSTRC